MSVIIAVGHADMLNVKKVISVPYTMEDFPKETGLLK